jgi:hypothetical protein
MSLLSKTEFATIARRRAGDAGLKGIVEKTRAFPQQTAATTLFLSHSHLDKQIVEQAKIFFENLGIAIYVDWADETMPEKPNATTAQKIKSQIATSNDKFVLLATNEALASRWCNWEVGIADAFKLPSKKMALLPLTDGNQQWHGNEYLQIYPRIEKNPTQTGGEDYFIWYPDKSWESIGAWLKK